jgi:cation diffusion facilitator family transporter
VKENSGYRADRAVEIEPTVDRAGKPVAIVTLIFFSEALPIACAGLLLNLASAWLLHDEHGHAHDHGRHGHPHDHSGHDTSIRPAYIHVMADALTSVLAIVALLASRAFGVVWLDPVMGIIGGVVILSWSITLVRTSGAVLLDAAPDPGLTRMVRNRLEIKGDRLSDLHMWQFGTQSSRGDCLNCFRQTGSAGDLQAPSGWDRGPGARHC